MLIRVLPGLLLKQASQYITHGAVELYLRFHCLLQTRWIGIPWFEVQSEHSSAGCCYAQVIFVSDRSLFDIRVMDVQRCGLGAVPVCWRGGACPVFCCNGHRLSSLRHVYL